MKIYFTGAISRMSDEDKVNYGKIVTVLENLGHKVITEVLKKSSDALKSQNEKEALSIQRKLTKWKKQADLVVVEGSTPSFGVGQEIALTLTTNKPVIVLHKDGVKPHILRDEGGDLLLVQSYTASNMHEVIKDAIEYASERQDTRFNFFISPQIGNYLDWIAKRKKLPRAVYLRKLIDEDIQSNKDYNV